MNWTWWDLDDYRGALEMEAPAVPPELCVELDVIFAEGATVGVWLFSETGTPLAIVRAGEA
jgi:hypothetical protein